MGKKMETRVFIPLETLNLLDSILPTGSSETDPLTLLAVHTCTLYKSLAVHLPAPCDSKAGLSQCWQDICFQTVPLKDVDITGMLERLLVPSKVLANTFRGTWVSLGRDGLKW